MSSIVVALGPKTAAALRARGIIVDIMPSKMRGEGTAEAVIEHLTGSDRGRAEAPARVLLPRAQVARAVLPETLRAAGLIVDDVPAYQTLPATGPDADRIRSLFDGGAVDIITATSSSTIRNLAHILGDDRDQLLTDCVIASIGPVTSATVRSLGMEVAVEASEPTVEALVESLKAHYEGEDD